MLYIPRMLYLLKCKTDVKIYNFSLKKGMSALERLALQIVFQINHIVDNENLQYLFI